MKEIFGAVLFLLPMATVQAVDSFSAELGHGTRGVDDWRVGVQWRQKPKWLENTNMHLYWDATLGAWESDIGTVQELGLTPTFRYGIDQGAYFDVGVGFHVLSETRISSQIEFSTKFQFGDHLGIGYRFDRYDVSMRLQHLSNAGIRNPNPGVNFLQVRFQYWLDKP